MTYRWEYKRGHRQRIDPIPFTRAPIRQDRPRPDTHPRVRGSKTQ